MNEWSEVPVPGERGYYCGYPVVVDSWTVFHRKPQVHARYTDIVAVKHSVVDAPQTFSRTLTEEQQARRLELENS